MASLLSASAVLGDYLSGLLQALATLGAVAACAWLALRSGALRGALGPRSQRLDIEDRLRLDARSQLLIVRVEQRRLLIATHTDSAARLLAELGTGSELAQPSHGRAHQPGAPEPADTPAARTPQPASLPRARPGTAGEP
jgi:flagellar biogenesis protein FliO